MTIDAYLLARILQCAIGSVVHRLHFIAKVDRTFRLVDDSTFSVSFSNALVGQGNVGDSCALVIDQVPDV